MRTVYFYRNIDARDLLDAFLVSSITSLLALRFYLHITGYPQIGGGNFHIAHMLWGGLFMLVAIVLNLAFLGSRARWTSAIVGGLGFGVFIDELGKFITEDNNYFYEPTIGLIYAIFVIMYLSFNFLTRKQKYHTYEYHMNILAKLEEAIIYDLDRSERNDIKAMLKASDQDSIITKELKNLVSKLSVSGEQAELNIFQKTLRRIDSFYAEFWKQRNSSGLVRSLFIAQILILIGASFVTVYLNIHDVQALFSPNPTYQQEVLAAQIISALVSGGFILYGLYLLSSSRLRAFEQFRRATLISIYLTQFFVFIRLEFQALPGFIASVILLAFISFVMRQDRRLGIK